MCQPRVYLLISCALTFGCVTSTEPSEEGGACIIGGDVREQFLLVSEAEADAIVRVEVTTTTDDQESVESCAGVLLSGEWVMTARHCAPALEGAHARVHFGSRAIAQPAGEDACGVRLGWKLSVDAQELVPHPELDLLLLRLAAPPQASGLDVVPARYSADDGVTIGQPIQLAGFGRSEGDDSTARQFVVEEVSNVTATTITVDGGGRSGACHGDSGGPLLLRDASGAIAAIGVLSAGSTDCRGSDDYIRLSGVAAWLDAILGDQRAPEPQQPCGAVGREGRCYGETAVWCDEPFRQAQECSPEEHCGWSDSAGGYRCVSAEDDPCQGISGFGRCDGGAAVRCAAGALERNDCEGRQCLRSSTTGMAVCET